MPPQSTQMMVAGGSMMGPYRQPIEERSGPF